MENYLTTATELVGAWDQDEAPDSGFTMKRVWQQVQARESFGILYLHSF